MDLNLVKEIVVLLTAVVGFAVLIWRSVTAERKAARRKDVADMILKQVTNDLPHAIGRLEQRLDLLPCQVKNENPEQ